MPLFTPTHTQDYRLTLDFQQLFHQTEYLTLLLELTSDPTEQRLLSGLQRLATELQLQASYGCGSGDKPDFDTPLYPHNLCPNYS